MADENLTNKFIQLFDEYKAYRKKHSLAESDELYKWKKVTDCQDLDLVDKAVKIGATNLVYTPVIAAKFKDLKEQHPDEFEAALKSLVSEDKPLDDRIQQFHKDIEAIEKPNSIDERTCAAILTCNNPQDYAFYQYTFYRKFCTYLGIKEQSTGHCYSHYLSLLNNLVEIINNDNDIHAILEKELKGLVHSDRMIAQDIIWWKWPTYKEKTTKDSDEAMDDVTKFKHILEYFVTHLNYLSKGNSKNVEGYNEYLKPFIDAGTFRTTGYGRKNEKIQEQIKKWQDIFDTRLCVNIYSPSPVSKGSYINWQDTGVNILVDDWNPETKFVQKLKIAVYYPEEKIWVDKKCSYTFNELGLYDGKEPNNNLRKFFYNYKRAFMTTWYGITDEMYEWCRLLKSKKNIILQGAPGTGKTYSTKELALLALDNYNGYEKDNSISKEYNKCQKQQQIFFTTFHQSMDYEDFVEGLKPVVVRDNAKRPVGVEYRVEPGIFKNAVEKAKEHPVVLIIDEINRGNVSKIFGELITLLEADKRLDKDGANGLTVCLPYSKESFSVPDDLYIIGTMNTTDRSTGSIDYAVRRRFAFITLKSDRNVVEKFYKGNEETGAKALNYFDDVKKFIEENKMNDVDFEDLMVGHSYFMADNAIELEDKMEYEVKPLLLEYYKDGLLKKAYGK